MPRNLSSSQVTAATNFFAANNVPVTGIVCNSDASAGNSVLSTVVPSALATQAAGLLASATGGRAFAQALYLPCGTGFSTYNSFTAITTEWACSSAPYLCCAK